MKLQDAVASVLARLDDDDAVVWSNDEIALYVKDGYDLFCRRTQCLFDIHVLENVPQTGNWSNDLERYLGEHSSGMSLTDAKLNFTGDGERDLGVGGAVGGSTEGPTAGTATADGAYFDHFGALAFVPTGRLPQGTVDVQRVTWDELALTAEDSASMRQLDNQYERRDGGDPRNFVFDKDGLLTIRLVPPARGDADYDTVSGSWGTMTQTSDATATIVGSRGILREIEGWFPAGGAHGSPTRQHPAAKNVCVEIARLGRSLDNYPFEISDAYIKFTIFWAMHRALKKNGVGQDLKLAKHFSDRFEMGIARAQARLKHIEKERVLIMGSSEGTAAPFDMGEPALPYPYGPKGRKI